MEVFLMCYCVHNRPTNYLYVCRGSIGIH
uniref:Uncharacterized protein n=1 Tax=Anguilla anguilla TaxID=7936 RepID=A0A0E9PAL1_ANGAN